MRDCKNIEIWKPIKGFEGFYEVSNLGRVRSLESGRWKNRVKILKPGKLNNGYLKVTLFKDGKPKTFLVHRLVAEHFIPNPLNLPQVNHKDENKENNCFENLEWCDAKYNSNYGTRTKKTCKKVYQYDKQGNFIREWESTMDVERELSYLHGNISQCCNRKRKSVHGFIWSYNKPLQ